MALSSPSVPTLDETLEGLSELSHASEEALVGFAFGEDPAWLVNEPALVHEVLGCPEDFARPAHPFAAVPSIYTASGAYALGLADKQAVHARGSWQAAVEQAETLASQWQGPELEITRALRERCAAWASQVLYGVDIDDLVPELVAATLAFEDEALDGPADVEGARARLAQVCQTLVARRGLASETELAARAVLPTLLNASVASALTLAWALYHLAHHPDALAQVRAELDANPAELSSLEPRQLPRCRAALLESLRLYPPTWLLIRSVERERELGGQALEVGDLIALCPWTLHRHPRWWREPEAFDPTRFERREPPVRGAWLPFGHGVHGCVGAHVALPMMQAVLATLVRRFDLRPASGPAPVLAARVSLRTEAGIRLALSKR